MNNVDQSFDLSKIIDEITDYVPLLLVLSALGSFVFVGFFSVHYYEKLFAPVGTHARTMAIVVSVITELVRLSLLLASVRDFTDKKPFNGWLGLVGSVALVFHEISVSRSIALMLSPEDTFGISAVLIFMVFVGFGLEVRLVMTMKKMKNSSEISFRKMKNSSEKKSPSSNGVYTADVN